MDSLSAKLITMFKRLFFLFLATLCLSACTITFPDFPGAKKSGLQVTSSPQATVFLDGNSLGLTPVLEEKLKPGAYTLKIIPTDSTLQPWEAKVTLTGGVLTVVDRKLSPIPDQSHGYVLSFEKTNNKDSQLAVSTLPDAVTVTIDGNPQGFTPLSLDSIAPGDHTIILSSPGFEDKLIRARAVSGFRLTVSAQLAKKLAPPTITEESTPSAQLTPSPTPTPTKKTSFTAPPSTSSAVAKPYVEIQNTPTGFLRVRSEPNTNGQEVAQVKPGEKYPYLNETEGGWHKIQYSTGKEGWVSGQYAIVVK